MHVFMQQVTIYCNALKYVCKELLVYFITKNVLLIKHECNVMSVILIILSIRVAIICNSSPGLAKDFIHSSEDCC